MQSSSQMYLHFVFIIVFIHAYIFIFRIWRVTAIFIFDILLLREKYHATSNLFVMYIMYVATYYDFYYFYYYFIIFIIELMQEEHVCVRIGGNLIYFHDGISDEKMSNCI